MNAIWKAIQGVKDYMDDIIQLKQSKRVLFRHCCIDVVIFLKLQVEILIYEALPKEQR